MYEQIMILTKEIISNSYHKLNVSKKLIKKLNANLDIYKNLKPKDEAQYQGCVEVQTFFTWLTAYPLASYSQKIQQLFQITNFDVLLTVISSYYESLKFFKDSGKNAKASMYNILPQDLASFVSDIYTKSMELGNLELFLFVNNRMAPLNNQAIPSIFKHCFNNKHYKILEYLLKIATTQQMKNCINLSEYLIVKLASEQQRSIIVDNVIARNFGEKIKEKLFYLLLDLPFNDHAKDLLTKLINSGVNISDVDDNNNYPLLRIIKDKSDELLQFFIDNEVDVNIKEPETHHTALHYAARYNQVNKAKMLISHGANMEAISKEGITPLLIALSRCNYKVVIALVASGANVENAGTSGYFPVHIAAELPKSKFLKQITYKAIPLDVFDQKGHTPMHRAAAVGCVKSIKLMLKKGISIEIPDRYGNTPLHHALFNKNISTAKYLIDNGANLEAKSSGGGSAFLVAAGASPPEILKILIEKKVNKYAVDNLWCSALHLAVNSGNIANIRPLLEEGLDIEATTIDGLTPLQLAVINGDGKVINELLLCGANVEVITEENHNLIHLAVINGDVNNLNLILEQSLNIELATTEGLTPLQLAVKNNRMEVIKELLIYSADINVITKTHQNLIHFAVTNCNPELIIILAKLGVNANAVTLDDNYSPLALAIKNNNKKVIEALISLKVNFNYNDPIISNLIKSVTPEIKILLEKYWHHRQRIIKSVEIYQANHTSNYIPLPVNTLPVNTNKIKCKKGKSKNNKSQKQPIPIAETTTLKIKKANTNLSQTSGQTKQPLRTTKSEQINAAEVIASLKRMEKEKKKSEQLEAERKKILANHALLGEKKVNLQLPLPTNFETIQNFQSELIRIEKLKVFIKLHFYSPQIYIIRRSEKLDHEWGRPGIIINKVNTKYTMLLGSSSPPNECSKQKYLELQLSADSETATYFYIYCSEVSQEAIIGKWQTTYKIKETDIDCIVNMLTIKELETLAETIKLNLPFTSESTIKNNEASAIVEEDNSLIISSESAIINETQSELTSQKIEVSDVFASCFL